MSNESAKSYSFHSDPWTIGAIIIGIVLAYFLFDLLSYIKKLFGGPGGVIDKVSAGAGYIGDKAAESVAIVSDEADAVAERFGYLTSDGQTDPTLLYNQARLAYAASKGIPQGTPSNPPAGFPMLNDWLAQEGLL